MAEKPVIAHSIGLTTSEKNESGLTGTWRSERPVFSNKIPPCQTDCPAHLNIPLWITLMQKGLFKEAWEIYVQENPFPAICGRVCYRFCEKQCNRQYYWPQEKGPVSINQLERFLGDWARANNLKPVSDPMPDLACWKDIEKETVRPSVAIIGSGPAGLSAAHYLAKNLYRVTIFEELEHAGGMLYCAIPRYRLPKDVLDDEIERMVKSLGVEIILNARVGSGKFSLKRIKDNFDYIFIATGAHKSKEFSKTDINLAPAEKAKKLEAFGTKFSMESQGGRKIVNANIFPGLDFLKEINGGKAIRADGKIVVVLGGGNTAIDAARSAVRLGAKKVIVVYRRSRKEMPAHPEEVEAALKEKIKIRFLTDIKLVLVDEFNVGIEKIICQKMKLGEPDKSGRRSPTPKEGSEFEIKADWLITAIGEEANLVFLQGENLIGIAEIGGDAKTGPSTVVQAIAAGKAAARRILTYSYGLEIDEWPEDRIITFEDLNPEFLREFYPFQIRVQNYHELKTGNFDEVSKTLSEKEITGESQRCFSCGTCNFCQNCHKFCPDMSIQFGDSLPQMVSERCKGCGVCRTVCPRGVIVMEEEKK